MKNFGQIIRHSRRRLGLSTEDLARRAGVSKTTVSFIENGKAKFSDRVMTKLEATLMAPAGEYAARQRLWWTPPELHDHMRRILAEA